MNIQSMSICVPSSRCINNCRYCCSKMHGNDYANNYSNIETYSQYVKSMRNALEFARDNECNTVILTGNNEPQQDLNFLKIFALVNQTISKPFRSIEMQTSGATINKSVLKFLKETVGITTIAVSVSCLDNPEKNRDITRTCDRNLNVTALMDLIKETGFNLRVCLNMNDHIVLESLSEDEAVDRIFEICKTRNADQITFRKLWSSESGETEEKKWIDGNVTERTDALIETMKKRIHKDGKKLGVLEFGATQYDYEGFSVVLDEDSMAQNSENKAVKYLILRPDGHLYSKWDSKASLLF